MKRIYKIVCKLTFRRIGRYKNTAHGKLFRFRFRFLNCLCTSGKPIGRIPNQITRELSYHLLCFSPIVNCHFFISIYSICQFEERCSFQPVISYRLTRWRLWYLQRYCSTFLIMLAFMLRLLAKPRMRTRFWLLWLNIHTCPKGDLLFCKKKKEKKIVLWMSCLTNVCFFVFFWF